MAAVAALLAACGGPAADAQPSATPPITPFASATASPTLVVESTPEFIPPTPTPFFYTVVQNDTFFGIAASLNIDLSALIAANPGVDPRFLSPGMELLIPSGPEASATGLPPITPVPAGTQPPVCYASAGGELWCYLPVVNEGSQILENVVGLVQLLDTGGEVLANIKAMPLLNILAPGQQMPLVAYLKEAPAGWQQARAELLSAFWLPDPAGLYLNVLDVDFEWTHVSAHQRAVRVQGQMRLAEDAAGVWVLAVAYDVGGNPVGVRRWEGRGETNFEFLLYSLGPAIAEVQVLVEAWP